MVKKDGRGSDGGRSSTGVRLREARLSASLTQQAAGELIGVEPNTIARYEAGRIKPSSTALFALAHIYDKPMAWFLDEEAQEPPSPEDQPSIDADRELVMNEASLALHSLERELSDEAIKSIADYIRFVHEREERERRESGEAE